ncbi:hypothetical protein PV328_011373 [Microctonus aethiopoides]|uniref:Diacylglycerol kinase type I N-terminal domain-containing protein n=1 Tax=Microctonus aethiopoides TaxID=144406 RepID=A0AA39C4H6_9HYME|nr:hypothetical protein PV328_011373 [Microctonus aethiopoides]
MTLHWEKLSPAEFQQLQDLAAYSTRKLEDVLSEFCGIATTPTGIPKYHPDGGVLLSGHVPTVNEGARAHRAEVGYALSCAVLRHEKGENKNE